MRPLTVVQSRYRVADASSNGGVGNLGIGSFTLDGGTIRLRRDDGHDNQGRSA